MIDSKPNDLSDVGKPSMRGHVELDDLKAGMIVYSPVDSWCESIDECQVDCCVVVDGEGPHPRKQYLIPLNIGHVKLIGDVEHIEIQPVMSGPEWFLSRSDAVRFAVENNVKMTLRMFREALQLQEELDREENKRLSDLIKAVIWPSQ